jgi:hypothetical protein
MQPTRFYLLSINPESYAFATPALRQEREERGTHGVGDARKVKAGPPPVMCVSLTTRNFVATTRLKLA